ALHWVPEQDVALGSIRAALRPEGRAVLRLVPRGGRRSLRDVIEEDRHRPRWAAHFPGFQRPHGHYAPDDYHPLSGASGFRAVRQRAEDKAWDFKTGEAFVAFGRATFVEWTRCLPEGDWEAFITEVLDLYRAVAADGPGEANTFKFYQMEVVLAAAPLA